MNYLHHLLKSKHIKGFKVLLEYLEYLILVLTLLLFDYTGSELKTLQHNFWERLVFYREQGIT